MKNMTNIKSVILGGIIVILIAILLGYIAFMDKKQSDILQTPNYEIIELGKNISLTHKDEHYEINDNVKFDFIGTAIDNNTFAYNINILINNNLIYGNIFSDNNNKLVYSSNLDSSIYVDQINDYTLVISSLPKKKFNNNILIIDKFGSIKLEYKGIEANIIREKALLEVKGENKNIYFKLNDSLKFFESKLTIDEVINKVKEYCATNNIIYSEMQLDLNEQNNLLINLYNEFNEEYNFKIDLKTLESELNGIIITL